MLAVRDDEAWRGRELSWIWRRLLYFRVCRPRAPLTVEIEVCVSRGVVFLRAGLARGLLNKLIHQQRHTMGFMAKAQL